MATAKPGAALKKITTRAKALKKLHPKTKWTDLVKKAAKELKTGKKVGSVSTKKASANNRDRQVRANAKKKLLDKGRAATARGEKAYRKSSPEHKAKYGVSAVKKPCKMATKSKPAHVAGVKKRRRVSGVKSKGFMHDLKMLGGSILGGMAGSVLQRQVPGKDMVKGVVGGAAGLALMHFSGEKHPLLYGIGNGIGTAGGVTVLHSTGMISGVEDFVAGIFDGNMNGAHVQTEIPVETAGAGGYVEGTHHSQPGLNQGGYMAATAEEIDKWVSEGIPPMGGQDWR
jgi:hypothetical protein